MKKLCNFNLPEELYDYLKDKSKSEFMTMTQFLIELIKKDKNENKKNI